MSARKIEYHIRWEDVISESTQTEIYYKSTGDFKEGEIISHNMFGLGFVIASGANKIEVLFQDKLRTLIHNFMY